MLLLPSPRLFCSTGQKCPHRAPAVFHAAFLRLFCRTAGCASCAFKALALPLPRDAQGVISTQRTIRPSGRPSRFVSLRSVGATDLVDGPTATVPMKDLCLQALLVEPPPSITLSKLSIQRSIAPRQETEAHKPWGTWPVRRTDKPPALVSRNLLSCNRIGILRRIHTSGFKFAPGWSGVAEGYQWARRWGEFFSVCGDMAVDRYPLVGFNVMRTYAGTGKGVREAREGRDEDGLLIYILVGNYNDCLPRDGLPILFPA